LKVGTENALIKQHRTHPKALVNHN